MQIVKGFRIQNVRINDLKHSFFNVLHSSNLSLFHWVLCIILIVSYTLNSFILLFFLYICVSLVPPEVNITYFVTSYNTLSLPNTLLQATSEKLNPDNVFVD